MSDLVQTYLLSTSAANNFVFARAYIYKKSS